MENIIKTKKWPWVFVAIVALLVIFVLGFLVGFVYGYKLNETENVNTHPDMVSKNEAVNEVEYEETYTYKLEQVSDVFNTEEYYDSRLVRYDNKGNKLVLVESTKDEIPELKKAINSTLQEFSFVPNSGKLFFQNILSETDAGILGFYSFDISDKTFSKMDIGPYLSRWGEIYLSPDGLKVVSIDDDENPSGKNLYLIDLMKDTAKVIVRLYNNESFVKYYEAFGGVPVGEIRWLDNNNIEYAVFESIASREVGEENPLIEKRILNLDFFKNIHFITLRTGMNIEINGDEATVLNTNERLVDLENILSRYKIDLIRVDVGKYENRLIFEVPIEFNRDKVIMELKALPYDFRVFRYSDDDWLLMDVYDKVGLP